LTAEELIAEYQGRGFDYHSSSKALGYLNDAYLVDICDAEDWPFLEATFSGTAPLEAADVRSIAYLLDSTEQAKLSPLDPRLLTDSSVDLEEDGTPSYYYVSEGKIKTFPASATASLLGRYYKVPPALSGSAVPVLPERFHSLIVDGAVARAYADSDDYELERNAEEAFQRRLQKMREALLDVYRDGPSEFIAVTNPDFMS
jgi:hypothetical protein